jgi:hypothetical protein
MAVVIEHFLPINIRKIIEKRFHLIEIYPVNFIYEFG